MVLGTFSGSAKVVEYDTTKNYLSVAEISEYSIRHYIQDRLNAWNWNVSVKSSDEGWPDYEALEPPAVVVELRETEIAGVELGSHGSRFLVIVNVFGENEAQRTRLAELITKNVFRDTVPIYDYITGNEVDPPKTGEYFITDNVGWIKVPSAYTAPDARRWRASVTASLRRVE
jgi:hypothetical protein